MPPPTPHDIPTFADKWNDFLASDAVFLAEDTLAFAQGRAQHLTFLVRIEDASAREYAARVTDRLANIAGVEPFPEWYWHITVKGAGFQVIKRTHDDDVLRQDVSRLASRARPLFERAPAFEAQLGPPNAFPGGVILEVHDGGAVRALNQQLLDVEDVARYEFDGAVFLPHVSIAQFGSREGLAELKGRLAALREEGPGPSFPVRRVELVRAWLTDEVTELETLATYALAPARRAGAAP